MTKETNPTPQGSRRVLLVDDSELIVSILAEELGGRGWAVEVATSGRRALEAYDARRHAVVVCDLHMPDMDGYDVLRALLDLDPDLPVVMHSGDEEVGSVLEAMRRGAFDYVLKSGHTVEPLLAALERAFAHHAVVEENARLARELEARLSELQREVQEREEAQRALARARDEAMAASRTKSAFLANMSHELRTPLNAILGYAELVSEDAADAADAELATDMEKILSSGRHLLELIDDLLDLAKIEAGAIGLRLEACDPLPIAEEVLLAVAPQAETNRTAVSLDAPEALPQLVTDARRVQQCLINLVGNACKFTEDGQVTVRIRPWRQDGRRGIRYEVIDTGIGMAAEQVEKVFGEFTQADAYTTRKYGGTGLGLAITRRLSEMLGGRVWAESELGVGSTFTLEIPDASLPTGQVPSRAAPRSETPDVVLVATADDTLRQDLLDHLEGTGFLAIGATTADEALQRAREGHPDLVCLDVSLQGRDGWTVLGELKNDPELTEMPVVMFTLDADQSAGAVLGAADFLVKPIQREDLTRVVRRHVPGPDGGTVLVVDDEPDIREVLGRMLRGAGWAVREAANGREALERVREERPALILLDLMMPEMDGFEVVERLRSTPGWQGIPVVVVTAMDMSPDLRRDLERQVAAVVQKGGYDRQGLLHEVNRLVRACLDAPVA